MPLTAGDKLGPYEVLALIGKGGMGEVYRAHDPRLQRHVAVKVSAECFTERFEREAKVVASLNHPNICHLYDVGPNYLVMELVEGPTLADRIKRGPMPLDETLQIARQIADALYAAHEKGIVHRDLKPGNIKINADGAVKVLDFGLAKASEPAPREASPEESPTLTVQQATLAGMILGTAAYMAPEQARGKNVDRRADIWAFGVVLYEMLTGKQTFTGETITDVLAAVVREEPDLTRVPEKVRRLVQSCLQKDPKLRLQAIGDWRLLLEDVQPVAARQRSTRIPWAVAGLFALITLAVLAFVHFREPHQVEQPMIRASLPEVGTPDAFALAPDGSRLAYVDGGKLFVRKLDSGATTELAAASFYPPFFSPDGKWIGFSMNPATLGKVSVEGGSAVPLASGAFRSGSWGEHGEIVAGVMNQPLALISAAGVGASRPLLQLDQGEIMETDPAILPGGRAVLYVSVSSLSGAEIRAVTLSNHKVKTLVKGTRPLYLASGHLAYADGGLVYVAPFDADALELRGTPVPILTEVLLTANMDRYAASRNGVLAFEQRGQVTVQLMDSTGELKPLLAPGNYLRPEFSPDGKSLAMDLGTGFVGVYDLERGALRRLGPAYAGSDYPQWTPDGRFLVFAGASGGLSWMRSDGATPPQRLLESKSMVFPMSISPDGKWLAYIEFTDTFHIMLAPLEISTDGLRAGKAQRALQSPGEDRHLTFSPDGKWIAYDSTQSGRWQVYVRAFPVHGAQWQVSTENGMYPKWSRTAHQLIYRTEDGRKLMAMSYTVKGDAFVADKPRVWSSTRFAFGGENAVYDLAPDGKHIAGIFPTVGAQAAPSMMLLFNFFDEVKRKTRQ